MRKDVIVAQAMGAGLVAWLVFSGSMLPVREALTVAALLLGVSLLSLVASQGARITFTVVPRTMASLWYGRPQNDFRDSRDHARTASAALWGVRSTWLVAWCCVALGLMMQLSTSLGATAPEVFRAAVAVLFVPLCLAGVINAVLWGPLHQTARLADELGAPTPYSVQDAVFPSLQRLRDGAFLVAILAHKLVTAFALFLMGSIIMGAVFV